MWCWGCDIRREAGNLLLAYGFQKRAAPKKNCSSAYTYWLRPDCALTLWGWGVWIAAQDYGSLLISRGGFRMRCTDVEIYEPQAWREADLPTLTTRMSTARLKTAHLLLVEVLAWIACYEGWLSGQTEPDYRQRMLEVWPQRRRCKGGIPALEMAFAWASLADSLCKETLDT